MLTEKQIEFMQMDTFVHIEAAARENCAIMIDHLSKLVQVDFSNKFGKIDDYDEWLWQLSEILADFEERNTFTAVDIECVGGISTAYYL